MAQQGLTPSALPASRLPGWVPRAPHICHPLSCQTHCFSAPPGPPPPSRMGPGPCVFPTHQLPPLTIYLQAVWGQKEICESQSEKVNAYKMQNNYNKPQRHNPLPAPIPKPCFSCPPYSKGPHKTPRVLLAPWGMGLTSAFPSFSAS